MRNSFLGGVIVVPLQSQIFHLYPSSTFLLAIKNPIQHHLVYTWLIVCEIVIVLNIAENTDHVKLNSNQKQSWNVSLYSEN